jgi:hypothetical protein
VNVTESGMTEDMSQIYRKRRTITNSSRR